MSARSSILICTHFHFYEHMNDAPPFNQPYQKLSPEFAQAMLEHAPRPGDSSSNPGPKSAAKPAAPSASAAGDDKFHLTVPFAEKDNAKALGARWDAAARKWYVPAAKDRALFKQWWPAG
jgi:hypothetical protein